MVNEIKDMDWNRFERVIKNLADLYRDLGPQSMRDGIVRGLIQTFNITPQEAMEAISKYEKTNN